MALDFLKSTILPKVYERKLQRRKIVLPVADKVLDASWTTSEYFRDGDPKLADFKKGCIFPRPELNLVRSVLTKSRFIFLQGPPSSGKTVIALNLAYEWSQSKRTALYFDRPSLLTDDFLDFLATSSAMRYLDHENVILFVDNVHVGTSRASRLFAFVYTNYTKLNLMFISRPLQGKDLEMDESVYYDFSRYMTHVDAFADSVIEPLADFFSKKRFGHGIPPAILRSFVEECGTDLLLLGRYLREWNGSSSVHLPELRRKVFQTVRSDLERLRTLSPDSVTALLVVSIFYRFEVPLERIFLERDLGLKIDTLLSRGELKEQNGFILLYHSSLAKLYANVCRSLGMPEYATLSAKYSPLPEALFAAYAKSEPRNLCEFVIGIRKGEKYVTSLLSQVDLHEALRKGLERTRNPNLLGWAMLVISVADHRNGWRVLQEARLDAAMRDLVGTATPGEISLFLFNLSKVSQTKGAECLDFIPPKDMARFVQSMGLGRAGAALGLIRDFSAEYFSRLADCIDVSAICQRVLIENDIDELRLGIRKLSQLFGDRICVKVSETDDAFGEPLNRFCFYFDTTKVVRFLKGRRLGIPYGVSIDRHDAYWRRLLRVWRRERMLTIDEGAVVALSRRASLFPVGVRSTRGEFQRGDVVGIADVTGRLIGIGVSNYSSRELSQIARLRSEDIASRTTIAPNRVVDNDWTIVDKRFFNIQEMSVGQGSS